MDPKEFCRQYFKIAAVLYIKDPADWGKIGDTCEYSNEWPANLSKHVATNITPSLKPINLTKADAVKAKPSHC
jgi:hypothetical protein